MEKYKPKKEQYIEKRKKLLINADDFCKRREMIIDAIKNKIFPTFPTGFSEDEEPPRDEDKDEKRMVDCQQQKKKKHLKKLLL